MNQPKQKKQFTFILMLLTVCSGTLFSQTQISYDAVVSGTWRFNKEVRFYGGETFFSDGLKSFVIKNSVIGSRLQIGIAEGKGHFSALASAGDLVIRKMGEGRKFIICNGATLNHPDNTLNVVGIIGAATGGGVWAHNNGHIRIGPYNSSLPVERLSVDGNAIVSGSIRTTEIKVEAQPADFVFEQDYYLRPLGEVESYILENKHLPDIPSAAQMEADGVNLAEMNKLLLQKIEELTLYMIKQQKEIDELKSARYEASN